MGKNFTCMEVFCNTAFYDNLRSLGVLFILYLAYIVNDSRSDSWLWKHAPECTHLLIGCCQQCQQSCSYQPKKITGQLFLTIRHWHMTPWTPWTPWHTGACLVSGAGEYPRWDDDGDITPDIYMNLLSGPATPGEYDTFILGPDTGDITMYHWGYYPTLPALSGLCNSKYFCAGPKTNISGGVGEGSLAPWLGHWVRFPVTHVTCPPPQVW